MRLAPTGVHAHEHRGPVERLGAPGSGIDVEDGPELILLPAQHVTHFERRDVLGGAGELFVHLRLGHHPLPHEVGHEFQILDLLTDGLVILDP